MLGSSRSRSPTDAYKIFFGGKNVGISADFQFDDKNPVTSTEVGTCIKPICKDTEALVEVQYWVGDEGTDTYRVDYRVEDQNGNININMVPAGGFYGSLLTRNQACVPRDNSCYTFLIGSNFQWDPTGFPDTPSYNLFYDGKLVRKNDSWLYDSAQFGDACQPRCNQANESLVEFFLYDDGDSHPHGAKYEYEWDLKLVTDDASDPFTSGVVPIGPDKSPLYYKTMCVPKDSCSSFYISAPQNATNILTYSLAMDGTTYRKTRWSPGFPDLSPNPQITNMGSCSVGDLCDKQSQDLFDLELNTPEKYKRDGRSAAMIQFDDVNWRFDYSEADNHFNAVLSSLQYNSIGYDLDSSYRTIECVPKGDCDFAFNITADSPIETYTVKKNGVQLDDRQELPDEFYSDRMWIMTSFGQNCFPAKSRTLSAGAIAGIVIGCLVVLSVLIGVIVVCLNRRKERQNQRDEEDPLSENLLQR
jgi:hypothetical protein